MPAYQYKARSASGKTVSGLLDAASERDAFRQLESSGHIPVSIRDAVKTGGTGASGTEGRLVRVRSKQLVPFTRQLATLVQAGIPILQGMDALWQQTEDESLRRVIRDLTRDIQGGSNLSRAMSRHPKAFSSFYVNSVAAGEAGGVLGEVLSGLADFLEQQERTRQDVRGALLYPCAVVCIMTGAITFLTTFVIPRFARMFAKFKTDLPIPTQVLIGFSHVMRDYWYLVVGGVVLFVFVLVSYLRTDGGRFTWDCLKLRLPVFGSLFRSVAMNRFAHIMALLTKSGLPLLQTLEVASRTVGNEAVSRQVQEMEELIASGTTLSQAMQQASTFTPMARNMIAIGEATGSSQRMFHAVAGHYDAEVKHTIRNMTTLIEPILTVALAGAALFLALSIFLPMWDMSKLFKNG